MSVRYINDEVEPTLMREAAEFSLLSRTLIPTGTNDWSMGMKDKSMGMGNGSMGLSPIGGGRESKSNQSLSTVEEDEEEDTDSDINNVSKGKGERERERERERGRGREGLMEGKGERKGKD